MSTQPDPNPTSIHGRDARVWVGTADGEVSFAVYISKAHVTSSLTADEARQVARALVSTALVIERGGDAAT